MTAMATEKLGIMVTNGSVHTVVNEHSLTDMNTKRDKEGKIEGKARNKGTTQREVIAKDVVEFHSLLNDS